MHCHLKKSQIEKLISAHTMGFLDTSFIVKISTGSVFRPMKLQTNVFKPKTGDLIQEASLTPATEEPASQFVSHCSAPLGILGISLSDMKLKCNMHIDEMISNPE